MEKSFVPELNQSYEFKNGLMIFDDGVAYTIEEAIQLARDRLTPEDLQAIHLVKKLFDGVILKDRRVNLRMESPADRGEKMPENKPVGEEGILDKLANEFGPPPIMASDKKSA